MIMPTRFAPVAALLIAFGAGLAAGPVQARDLQDSREARLAAAHAAVDAELEAAYSFDEMRDSLTIEGLTSQEQAAVIEAARSLSPQLIRDAQNIAAVAMADNLPLSLLQTPEVITEAQFAMLSREMEPQLSALGGRFARAAVTKGCQVTSQPSEVCRIAFDTPPPPMP